MTELSMDIAVPGVAPAEDAIIARERAFHDARFAKEHRSSQWKYYDAIRDLDSDYEAAIRHHAAGRKVLDYGCSLGRWALELAPTAEHVTGIDISEVAIAQATEKAQTDGLANTRFEVADAHRLPFPDASFDLVFGSGIIHHLDVRRSLTEISRVLAPGGIAVFKEPLGRNPIINAYRAMTPKSRTEDEHPLMPADFAIADETFGRVDITFYGLTTLAYVPFRNWRIGPAILGLTRAIDRLLFRTSFFKWQAWHVLILLRK